MAGSRPRVGRPDTGRRRVRRKRGLVSVGSRGNPIPAREATCGSRPARAARAYREAWTALRPDGAARPARPRRSARTRPRSAGRASIALPRAALRHWLRRGSRGWHERAAVRCSRRRRRCRGFRRSRQRTSRGRPRGGAPLLRRQVLQRCYECEMDALPQDHELGGVGIHRERARIGHWLEPVRARQDRERVLDGTSQAGLYRTRPVGRADRGTRWWRSGRARCAATTARRIGRGFAMREPWFPARRHRHRRPIPSSGNNDRSGRCGAARAAPARWS